MIPLLFSLVFLAPAEARLVTGSGLRLRAGPDVNAAVVATRGFGSVVACSARSAVVDVGGVKGVFCKDSDWPVAWYFEPNTVAVAKDADAQLRAEIEKRLALLKGVAKERFPDVYDLQFFLLRHAQLDDVSDAERARLVADELALVHANPAAFVGDARLTSKTPLPAPSALALVAKGMGLDAKQLAQLDAYNLAVRAQRKSGSAQSWCALEQQADDVVKGLPTDRWSQDIDRLEPKLAQLSAALTGIDVWRGAEGVGSRVSFVELAGVGPKDVGDVVIAIEPLLEESFSAGFTQVTDIQACLDVAVFGAALDRAFAVQAKLPPCVRKLLDARLAVTFPQAERWNCFCLKRPLVEQQLPAFHAAAAKWRSTTVTPPVVSVDGAKFADECEW